MSAITATAPSTPASTVARLIKAHPVAAFLILVYGISWTLFLPSLLSASGLGLLPFDIPLQPFILLSTFLGITLPGVIVTRVTAGKEGTRELRGHYTAWRVNPAWYLVALFALPLACVLAAGLWLGGGPIQAFAGQWTLLFTGFLPQALLIAVLVSLWEEGGWTGFLLPRLQQRWGALLSSVMLAVCQGLFHVPLLFIVGGVSDQRVAPSDYGLYLIFLFVLTIPVRMIMTWLWNSTRGSLIIVALFHGAFNTVNSGDFIHQFVPGDTSWIFAVYAVLGLLLVILTRGRLGHADALPPPATEAPAPRQSAPTTV
jgi:membrane protease YdiL (CAAX protease family)